MAVKTLRGKLAVSISAVTLVCMMIMAVITYNISSGQVEKLSIDSYRMSTENTTNQIRTWLTAEQELLLNQAAMIEVTKEYEQEFLAGYLTGIVNGYNEEGYIYDLYYTSEENVMASGTGYVPDPSVDFKKEAGIRKLLVRTGWHFPRHTGIMTPEALSLRFRSGLWTEVR